MVVFAWWGGVVDLSTRCFVDIHTFPKDFVLPEAPGREWNHMAIVLGHVMKWRVNPSKQWSLKCEIHPYTSIWLLMASVCLSFTASVCELRHITKYLSYGIKSYQGVVLTIESLCNPCVHLILSIHTPSHPKESILNPCEHLMSFRIEISHASIKYLPYMAYATYALRKKLSKPSTARIFCSHRCRA